VVLREPGDVRVPLPVAASAPRSVPGRCVISTSLVGCLCGKLAAANGQIFGQQALAALQQWLDIRFPDTDPRFQQVADRDGATMLESLVADTELKTMAKDSVQYDHQPFNEA
jgi:hypothetical protein